MGTLRRTIGVIHVAKKTCGNDGLTTKQRIFANAYLECYNASEAARRAGYSLKTAGVIGKENLQKPKIKKYIEQRLGSLEKAQIASVDEVLCFFTSVMRGEGKDGQGDPPRWSDRLKAAAELMARYTAAESRQGDDAPRIIDSRPEGRS